MADPPADGANPSPPASTIAVSKRNNTLWRIVGLVLGAALTLLVIAVVVFVIAVHRGRPPQPGSFYTAPSPLPNKPLGAIIRSEPLVGLPTWAKGWRILYLSTSYTGKPAAVSGMVIVPNHPSSRPRPVVAFANGTVGIASNCALSIQAAKNLKALTGLQAFLAAGDVAVMSDYQGLGTPGPHPYLVGTSEGEDVLDAVRAAHNLKGAHAGTTFAVTGLSQGGHAALFAGQLASTYAPDLKLVGIGAWAPPTDLKELFQLNSEGIFGRVLSAYALDAWSRVYGHNLESVFTPVARPVVHRIVRLCLHNTTQTLAFIPLNTILNVGYLKVLPWQTEPWKTLLKQNSPGQVRIPAPILIAQGGADQLVHAGVTATFVKHLCSMGETVQYRVYPGVNHLAGAELAPNLVKWITDRFKGKAPPSTC